MPVRRFNPCNSCCRPVLGVYFWYIFDSSIDVDFEPCGEVCGRNEEGEDLPFTTVPFGSGHYWPLSGPDIQRQSEVTCNGELSFGWQFEMERSEDNPIVTWRARVYKYEIPPGPDPVFDPSDLQLDLYGIGPYEGTGSVEETRIKKNEETGEWEGGIWLYNQNSTPPCQGYTPPRILLIDGFDTRDYPEMAGVDLT